MTNLTVRNIGPGEDIQIPLNRVNIFMGPQSSGKSTIAKVISFCQWLEKDCVRRQKVSHVDDTFTQEAFIDYHNIRGYISEDSYFLYEGRILKIEFKNKSLRLSRESGFREAKISKNAYIPSERNLISVPGIFKTKMPDNYILDFLSDWKQIRQQYSGENSTEILPTGDSYYYDGSEEEDMLRLRNGKCIALSQASSGLQAITPLVVYINYVTDWIYSHDEMKSADDKTEVLQAALANVMDSMTDMKQEGILDIIEKSEASSNLKENFLELLKKLQRTPEISIKNDELLRRIIEVKDEFSRPAFSNIVIEEPEQNLFPQTQKLLIEHILSHHNTQRDTLVVTTHSPFVLYSVNNCMLAYMSEQRNPSVIEEMTEIPKSSYLNPKEVNVWELRDGHIENAEGALNTTVQDSEGLIRDNYFDRIMGNVMTDFQNMIGLL